MTPTAMTTAAQFVALRTSDDPAEQRLAATLPASEGVWLEVIAAHPDMRFWVAQNKTVPAAVLRVLAADPDAKVRHMVASKRKCEPDLLARLAIDPDPAVRLAVAYNPNTPTPVLERLSGDEWERVREVVAGRLADG
jgi:hypothetical protein